MGEKRQDRRCFLHVAGGAVAGAMIRPARRRTPFRGETGNIGRSSPVWQRAREVVRSGQLGRVAFCRSFLGATSRDRLFALIDCVQFVFDEAAPVSVSAQAGPLGDPTNLVASFRYPGFVASFEQRAGAAERTVICGTDATLVVGPHDCGAGCSTCGPIVVNPSSRAQPGHTEPGGVWHWGYFLESIRLRCRPAAVAAGLVEMALREGRAIDCSRKAEAAWT